MYLANEKRYSNLPVRRVGNTGLVLPVVSLGLWHHFDSSSPYYERKNLILQAFDRGIFSFDCADRYGSPEVGSAESLLGNLLRAELKPYRDELVITTKVGFRTGPGPFGEFLSRKSILQSVEHSLQRLGTDYVDIYYAHRFDPQTDLFESLQALDQVVREGKALYIGISNFDSAQTKRAVEIFKDLGTPFTVNQVSYNMLNQSVEKDGLLATLKEAKKGLVAYGPLAEGLLSARYLKRIPEDFKIHRTSQAVFDNGTAAVEQKLHALNKIASARGQNLSQLALAWLLRNEVVASVIIGTTSLKHLEDDLGAVKNLAFSKAELQQLTEILQ
ncbi:aldo/keto reductase [Liquorilactobacillus satsumensis]|uniref:Aldo keto reductase n=1 Tax=Liquorilactobacillus satsumensis DSM 16230 = JCM 12392 TaxID=1423801 RepID=A0A0R1UXF8_9LACO|nr:aldo/keto reductase [Liquorilactobacillus satsumensis]KRL97758.1 aldo keto reductase [Liquorilactobacillus satsumensis DSM 16230 = JCM 12392]MCC7666180.1 aldo/keto reductase [Liquorilactobacillus satsumensis]MCP9357447.1 aldo/keto reductase [Liquorilactobacillus satsumensis]MCP9371275.1 aldo/keto reductase [Liquorilactobacillus satsumensis]